MGCGSSKADASPSVALCRERRDLIREAADHRYALAAAHESYFRALAGVGDALHRFVQEVLTVVPSPPLPSSPVITLRPSDVNVKSKSDGSSATPLSHSLSPEDSHIHLSSESNSEESLKNSPPINLSSDVPSPSYYFMRSSTSVPSMIYENPNSWYSSYGAPIGSPDDRYMGSQEPAAETTPPPPPPPGGSTWDFFNPFDSYEQYMPSYSQERYGMGSLSSSPSSSEVREREGIPDLEDETEQEISKEVKGGKKMVVDGDVEKKDLGEGSSKAVPAKEKDGRDDTIALEEKKSKSRSETSGGKSSGEAEAYTEKKEVILEEEESGPSNGNILLADGTRDVVEVVKEIKELFKFAAASGEEVSRMLEVGKLNYRSANRIYTVISSRILEPMGLSLLTSLRPSFKHSRHSAASVMKNKASHADFERHIGMKSGNLSSTMEKLYVWEKKLYKEVKDEEKLRINYDKKCRRLRSLDNRGAESYKINSTRASVRRLKTKISIIIKSVDAISSRMHKLRDEELQPQLIELIQGGAESYKFDSTRASIRRLKTKISIIIKSVDAISSRMRKLTDEELQPQLIELIQGLIRMWKSMECHKKQFRAIVDSKSHNLMAKTGVQGNSVVKATRELELELLNWYSSFHDWISIQKSFIEALNGCLMKWLPHEQEETPDGVVPFSPSRIGAPSVFIISNDWYNVIRRISEVEVEMQMHTFAVNVHRLWESQGEEQHQNLKVESLSRDYAKRLKSLRNDSGVHGNLEAVSVTDNGQVNHDDLTKALDLMRKRLDEERAKHEEIVKQVQEAASTSLRIGLIPIFEALSNFTSQTLKAYEELRIPNEGGGT